MPNKFDNVTIHTAACRIVVHGFSVENRARLLELNHHSNSYTYRNLVISEV